MHFRVHQEEGAQGGGLCPGAVNSGRRAEPPQSDPVLCGFPTMCRGAAGVASGARVPRCSTGSVVHSAGLLENISS